MENISIVPLGRQHMSQVERWFEGRAIEALFKSPRLPEEEILSQSDTVRAWVALEGQEPVAVVIVSKTSEEVGYMSFAVHPGSRRRGLGSEIVGRVVNSDVLSDLARIRVAVDMQNIAAQKILLKNGFTNVGHNSDGHLEFERRSHYSMQ